MGESPLSPGDICTRQNLLTTQSQLFLVVGLESGANSARVKPISSTQKEGYDTQVQTNKGTFWACEEMKLSMPIDSLCVADVKLTSRKIIKKNSEPVVAPIPKPAPVQIPMPKTKPAPKVSTYRNTPLLQGDLCKAQPDYQKKFSAPYYLVIQKPKNQNAMLSPIVKIPLDKEKYFPIKINHESYYIHITHATKAKSGDMVVLSRGYTKIADKVLEEMLALDSTQNKTNGHSEGICCENTFSRGDIVKRINDSSNSLFIVESRKDKNHVLISQLYITKSKKKRKKCDCFNVNDVWFSVSWERSIKVSTGTLIVLSKADLKEYCDSVKQGKAGSYHQNDTHDAFSKSGQKKQPNSGHGISTKEPIKEPTKNVSGQTLYIYKGRIICHRREHSIIPATARFYNKYGKEIKVDVEYCQDCKRLMLNYTSFCYYRQLFGVMIGNMKMLSSSAFDGEFYMAPESPLKLCGYNVSQADGLTDSERHYILAKIIHENIMKKIEVIHYLEHFINMNGMREGNELALEKWENDLDFVHKYKIDTQPEIYINSIKRY